MEGISRGLNLPGLPGLGIMISRTPIHKNLFFSTASLSSRILFFVSESMSSSSGSCVNDPLLLFSFR